MSKAATARGHLISVRDLSREDILGIFAAAEHLQRVPRVEARTLLAGTLLGTLFFQPSTRTRLGFEASAVRLGAAVTGFADATTSRSVDYIAETLEDTARVVGEMCDLIVIRHFQSGAARRAALAAGVPVISGGDGSNEHPTQALADVWLMSRRLGSIHTATVGIVGDPGARVLRSLVLTLSRLGVGKLLFLVPPNLPLSDMERTGVVHTTLPPDLREFLANSGTAYEFRSDADELLTEADAIEMMPVSIPALEADPRSLLKQVHVTPERYRITAAKVRATRSQALILHPGPRSEELHPDVDDLPNSLYFQQVRDSIFLRMAVLVRASEVSWLGAKEIAPREQFEEVRL